MPYTKHTQANCRYLLIALLSIFITLAAHPSFSLAQQHNLPRKIAFIVGVSEYQKDGLANLKYAHKDANDLSAELSLHGFEVTKLIGSAAKHKDVRKQLQQFITKAAELGKQDVVLVSFSGHGVQKMVAKDGRQNETPFFCVYDTMVTKPATMISLNDVLEELKETSGCSNNLLIVDACRNNPDKGARTLDGSTVKELPTKISMLFSSSPGQKSFESEKVNQGIFTHVLLKGLRGDASNSRGQVKWASLATYVLEEVPLHTADLLGDSSIQQRPNLVGNFVRSPVLREPNKYDIVKREMHSKGPSKNRILKLIQAMPTSILKSGKPSKAEAKAMLQFLTASKVYQKDAHSVTGNFGANNEVTIWVGTYGKDDRYGVRFGTRGGQYWGSNSTYFELAE